MASGGRRATVPAPEPGMVCRYDYLRPREFEEGIENPKERPAGVLLVLQAGEALNGVVLIDEQSRHHKADFTAETGDVLIFPIQSDPPSGDQLGVELSIETKRYVGLSGDEPSWAVISEVNLDRWPSSGLGRVPGTRSFVYPRKLPGPIMSVLARTFLQLRRKNLVRALARA